MDRAPAGGDVVGVLFTVFLILLVTCSWGLNYPIMKFVVTKYPPSTFRALTFLLGTAVLGVYAWYRREPLHVPPEERWTTVRLSIPNMVLWHVGLVYGISLLNSGRAAIIGYTMPVWAVLSGLAFFGERIGGRALLGIVLAMAGAGLLLSSEFAAISGQPLGTVFALIAAAAWGLGTVLMKRTRLDMPTISLTFWMLALTTAVMLVLSALFEQSQWRMPNAIEWAGIVYNAAIIFGFAHVVWFRLARLLPPVVSSLSVMFIPVVGTFSGAWMLGETPQWQDYLAMLLILGSMSTVLFQPRERAQ